MRTRKGFDVTIDSRDSMEGLSWDILRKWQKEFQEDFCKDCINFDLDRQYFINKDHPNNLQDCISHWTDIVGVCWNFKHRVTGESIDQLLRSFK